MKEKILKATHAGELKVGDIVIPCAVLEDGTRVLSRAGFLRAIGRRGNAKTGPDYDDFKLPVFLVANNLKSFISADLLTASKPIRYKPQTGAPMALGYRADILPLVCNVFLEASDAKALTQHQTHIAEQCKVLIRGFAMVGINALVDEATGYQKERDQEALQKILAAYISKELLPWTQRFPEEFYREMFRLRGWQFNPISKRGPKGPRYAGKLTNELVYRKLPPHVLEELSRLNPADEKWQRKHKHHQLLTEDIGNPHLEKQVAVVTTLMRISPNWRAFERHFQRAFPASVEATQLGLFPPEDNDELEQDEAD